MDMIKKISNFINWFDNHFVWFFENGRKQIQREESLKFDADVFRLGEKS